MKIFFKYKYELKLTLDEWGNLLYNIFVAKIHTLLVWLKGRAAVS